MSATLKDARRVAREMNRQFRREGYCRAGARLRFLCPWGTSWLQCRRRGRAMLPHLLGCLGTPGILPLSCRTLNRLFSLRHRRDSVDPELHWSLTLHVIGVAQQVDRAEQNSARAIRRRLMTRLVASRRRWKEVKRLYQDHV